ncbi:hypothetical protein CSUI_004679 [Cystoisospora suis]|uniref:Uncharacterized protein n=1 Tax=Cystoisospora suis TaxID=483139 RepID=A0A2C6KAH9_9APIC|nr:hypothetical protein CSUI_004679 [Cystoisospora suis]
MMIGPGFSAETRPMFTTPTAVTGPLHTADEAGSFSTSAVLSRARPRFCPSGARSVTTEEDQDVSFLFSLLSRPSLFLSRSLLSSACSPPSPGVPVGAGNSCFPIQQNGDPSSPVLSVSNEESFYISHDTLPSSSFVGVGEKGNIGELTPADVFSRSLTVTCSGGGTGRDGASTPSTVQSSFSSTSRVEGERESFHSSAASTGLSHRAFRALLVRLGCCFSEDPNLDSCCTAARTAICRVLTTALSRTAQAGGRLADLAGYYCHSFETFHRGDETRPYSSDTTASSPFREVAVSSLPRHLTYLPTPFFSSGDVSAAFASAVSAFTTALKHLKFGEGEGDDYFFSSDICPRRARHRGPNSDGEGSASSSHEREGEQHTAGHREEDAAVRGRETSRRQRLRIRSQFHEGPTITRSCGVRTRISRIGHRSTDTRPSHNLSVYACAAGCANPYSVGLYKRRRLGFRSSHPQGVEREHFRIESNEGNSQGSFFRGPSEEADEGFERFADVTSSLLKRKKSFRRGEAPVNCAGQQGGRLPSNSIVAPQHDLCFTGSLRLCRDISVDSCPGGSGTDIEEYPSVNSRTGGVKETEQQQDLSWTQYIPSSPAILSRSNSSWSVKTVESRVGCTPTLTSVTSPPSLPLLPVFSTSTLHRQLRRGSSSSTLAGGITQTTSRDAERDFSNSEDIASPSVPVSPILLPASCSPPPSLNCDEEEGASKEKVSFEEKKSSACSPTPLSRTCGAVFQALESLHSPSFPSTPSAEKFREDGGLDGLERSRKVPLVQIRRQLVSSKSTNVLSSFSSGRTAKHGSQSIHHSHLSTNDAELDYEEEFEISSTPLRRTKSSSADIADHFKGNFGFGGERQEEQQQQPIEETKEKRGSGYFPRSRGGGCKAFFFPPFVKDFSGIGSLHLGGRRLRNLPRTTAAAHPSERPTSKSPSSSFTTKSPSPLWLHHQRPRVSKGDARDEEFISGNFVTREEGRDCCGRTEGGRRASSSSQGRRGGGEEEEQQGSYQTYLSWHEDKWSERVFDHVEVEDVSIDPLHGAGCVIM